MSEYPAPPGSSSAAIVPSTGQPGGANSAIVCAAARAAMPRRRKFFVRIGVVVVLLGAIGGFAYWNSPQQHFRRGLAALEALDLERAEYESAVLRGFLGYDPHSRLLRGAILLRSARPLDWNEAFEELENAIEHPETRLMALTLGGQAQYMLGNFRPAEAILGSVLKEDPDNVEAHRWSAAAYFDMGAMQHALYHMRRVAELDPVDPRPYWMMGSIYRDAGDLHAAARNYRQALQLSERQPADHAKRVDAAAVRFELAQTEAELGQFSAALEVLAECAESADMLALRGICQVNLKEVRQARKCFEEALRLEPEHMAALRFLGQLALDAGDVESSEQYLSLAVVRYPKDVESHELLSRVRRRQGRDAEADKETEQAEALRRKRAEFTSLQQQLAANPADAQLRKRIGKLAIDLNLSDVAWRSFRASLEMNPGDPEAVAAVRELMGQMVPRAQPTSPAGQGAPVHHASNESH